MLLDLTITARGPLAFPERRFGEQFRSSLGYVPGGAIYGALGAQAFDAKQFRELRCHNAYPVADGDPWSRPLPMSALQPKGQENAPIYDSLVERVCWERQRPAGLIYAPTDADGRAWEVVKHSFYTLRSDGLKTRSAVQRVLTRVAIDRQRGTAAASRLYSPLVLNEVMQSKDGDPYPSTFRGSVSLPDDDALCAALKQIDALGARQTSGLGAVTMTVSDANGDDHLKQRVEDLTRRFREQAKAYRELGGAKWMVRGHVFTVNLLADAILREQGWLPTQELSVAALKELTGIEATLLRSFSNTAVVGGWHATWREPKPTALATSMGSVFVFHVEGGLSDQDFIALAKLQTDGIGERRPEGFGQVRICDEFHITEALRH
jgi:CRISPR-associated protein Csx10